MPPIQLLLFGFYLSENSSTHPPVSSVCRLYSREISTTAQAALKNVTLLIDLVFSAATFPLGRQRCALINKLINPYLLGIRPAPQGPPGLWINKGPQGRPARRLPPDYCIASLLTCSHFDRTAAAFRCWTCALAAAAASARPLHPAPQA